MKRRTFLLQHYNTTATTQYSTLIPSILPFQDARKRAPFKGSLRSTKTLTKTEKRRQSGSANTAKPNTLRISRLFDNIYLDVSLHMRDAGRDNALTIKAGQSSKKQSTLSHIPKMSHERRESLNYKSAMALYCGGIEWMCRRSARSSGQVGRDSVRLRALGMIGRQE